MSVLRSAQLPVPLRAGPDDWPLVLASGGPLTVDTDGAATTRLEPGDLVLCEPSHAVGVHAAPGSNAPRALVLYLPRHALAVPHRALLHLAGRPVSSDHGAGVLLARFVEGLADHLPVVSPSEAEQLGTAAISLSTAFLTGLAARHHKTAAAPSRSAVCVRDITAYIDRHLDDPDLSPTRVASAHYISVRNLHFLFQQDGRTVCGYIRARRLERCRADLVDLRLADRPVNEIGARWGFPDAPTFSRAFTRAYGVAPGEYRRRQLRR
jgi:AraC-like DNA-binding protein